MKKSLFAVLLASFAFSAAAKDLLIGTEATYAPFEFYNDKNEIVGFDIDVINKVCEKMETSCKIVNQSFDSLIPSLKTRRIDAAIAGIDITPERLKQIDFSDLYHSNNGIRFIILKNSDIKDLTSLKGKRIGIQGGTAYQKYLDDKYPDSKVVTYESYQYALLDLKAGRIDSIACSALVAEEWLGKESDITPLTDKIIDKEYFGEGLGIAIRKGNSDLLNKFNQALASLKEDGTLNEIYKKWFLNK
ncbi:transporter substrate-binding domain-containing protein [Orbaceae bacterium ac157xtp]